MTDPTIHELVAKAATGAVAGIVCYSRQRGDELMDQINMHLYNEHHRAVVYPGDREFWLDGGGKVKVIVTEYGTGSVARRMIGDDE